MRTEDVEKMAFSTHHGHNEFMAMPFELTDTPSTFQAFFRKFVLIFFDDILV